MTLRIIQSDAPLSDEAVLAVRDVLRAGAVVSAAVAGVNVRETVEAVIEGVRHVGDRFVIANTEQMHDVRLTPETLLVPGKEIAAAHAALQRDDPDFLALVRRTIANIRAYQESILTADPPPLKRGGRTLSVRYTPMRRVCVYVPGGRAIYPSTVLMTAVPAQVAGVDEIVMVTPPGDGGDVHPVVLALAGELGIREVYRAAGVAGLAAAAIGTETLTPVDKIVGPGNAFIAETKRQLFGTVGIDSIAGPSEVLIVADATARADWIAADMLAQAEHDPGSAVLVTDSRELAAKVAAEIDVQTAALERAQAIGAAIDAYSAAIVIKDIDTACDVANDFATEHLQIITADPTAALEQIRNAGAIFLGPQTPVPLGDYYAGPSHVLPTGGTARFFGPLSCNDFRKASSIVQYNAAAAAEDAADVIDFATREGLTAHAKAMKKRRTDD